MPWKGCARRWQRQACRKRPRRRSLLRASDWGGHDARRVPGPAPRSRLRRAGRAARRRGGEPYAGMGRVPPGERAATEGYGMRDPPPAISRCRVSRNAEAKRGTKLSERRKGETPPAGPPAGGGEKRKAAELRVHPQKSPKKAGTSGARMEGAGGD